MDVLVVGAGAMGAAIGAQLAAAGNAVTLYDIDEAHMAAIARSGLVVRGADGLEVRQTLGATTDPAQIERADIILVMTKSWATTDAVAAVAHAVGAETWVVSAQNGLGNGARIAEVIDPSRVMAGTTTIGATYVEPGVVTVSGTVTTGSSLTQFGLPPVVTDPGDAQVVADLFTDAGLRAEILPDVDQVIWTKVCMAGTAGCLTALAQITIGDMVASPEAMDTWRLMLEEVFAVASAEGVTLDQESVTEHALATYRTVGAHRASMAVDIRERRRTEVDALCGEISRLGRHHGVATPVNDVVANLIRAIERSWLSASG